GPTLTVCLGPELMPAAAVELLAGQAEVCWWFADDPFSFERRRLSAPPPVLRWLEQRVERALVAHPAWTHGPLAGAPYLPYAARFDTAEPAWTDASRRPNGCVVVASPRPERAQLL